MINLRYWLNSFPKWAIAIGIVIISTAVFAIWWLGRKDLNDPEMERLAEDAQAVLDASLVADLDIDPQTMFVSGRQIYQFEDGAVVPIHEIQFGFRRSLSPIAELVYREENFILGDRLTYYSFHKNGRLKGEFALPNGYVTRDLRHVIYAYNGDLHRGEIDWYKPEFANPQQITQLGYFEARRFASNLRAATGNALLYQTPQHGLVHVNLHTGEAERVMLPVNFRQSPDGSILIGDAVTGNVASPVQLLVFDIDKKELKQFPLASRMNQGESIWLDLSRCLFACGAQLYLYDHAKPGTDILYSGGRRIKLLHPSLGQRYALLNDYQAGLVLIEIASKKTIAIPTMPLTGFEWLSDDAAILVADVPDSQHRGSWFYKIGSEPKRILPQPLYPSSSQGNVPKFYFKNAGKTLINSPNGWILIEVNSGEVTTTDHDFKAIIRFRE